MGGFPVNRAEPTVVTASAAAEIRTSVFERRSEDGIDPNEVLARMVAAGHGSDFPSPVRKKRLKTWVLQVLRRLRKCGWLGAPGPEGWPPTAALRGCSDPAALARRASRLPEPEIPAPSPPEPETPVPSPPEPETPAPSPPESWEAWAQDWVFGHRLSEFRVGDLAAAMVQRGYGEGSLAWRLDDSRELAEDVLRSLMLDGLLIQADRTAVWMPTEMLRTWPEAD